MTTFRYPQSRVVVLGLCPGNDHPTPLFGQAASVSASRMNDLEPTWRVDATGANAWSTRAAYQAGEPSNVEQILRETRCRVIVALGREVQDELDVAKAAWFTTTAIRRGDRTIKVVRFPHPSGLNRFWNDPQNVVRARKELRRALWTPPYERGTMFP